MNTKKIKFAVYVTLPGLKTSHLPASVADLSAAAHPFDIPPQHPSILTVHRLKQMENVKDIGRKNVGI